MALDSMLHDAKHLNLRPPFVCIHLPTPCKRYLSQGRVGTRLARVSDRWLRSGSNDDRRPCFARLRKLIRTQTGDPYVKHDLLQHLALRLRNFSYTLKYTF